MSLLSSTLNGRLKEYLIDFDMKNSFGVILTRKEIDQKARLTTSFLKTKLEEFEILRDEIAQLKLDAEEISNDRQ